MTVVLPYREFFHYTSFDGLIGILRSRILWATSAHHLNDEQEFRHGYSIVCHIAERCAKAAPKSELLRRLRETLKHWPSPYVFVFSLSANGDLLSQWRGYCPSGSGVAIGFPEPLLVTRANAHGFLFAPCLYNGGEQMSVVENVFREAMAEEASVQPSAGSLLDKYLFRLVQVALRLKHDTFSEEQEWRLISPPLSMVDHVFGFRTARSMLVPFFNFTLADSDNHSVQLGNIYVGPNPNIELAMSSVSTLIHSVPNTKVAGVVRSLVPYRTW